MAVEIILTSSSDDEPASAAPRTTSTMILSDSSDDDSSISPPPRPSYSQGLPSHPAVAPRPLVPPVAGPSLAEAPQLGGAARKSSFGGARVPPRRTLVTKHGAPQPSQRPSTPRTVVKPEPDDEAPLAALRALRSEDSIADVLDPRVEAIPYPFDVSVRLEEVRLALNKIPTRPIVKLDVAFRHVDQSASTASIAASTSFLLPVPPHLVISSPVDFPLDEHLSIQTFHIPGNPSLPLGASDPPSSSASSRRPPRPDVRDIVIRVSIVDMVAGGVAERLYESATAMTEGSRLSLRGENGLRRSAAGSQVVVSWTVELENDGSRAGVVTDEALVRWLEQEMRRCEIEWRNEAAERALQQLEIEEQPQPTCGPPSHLVLDPAAPSPADLIPGLAARVPPLPQPLAFAPIPRYHYTGFASRGVPLVGTLLEAFPQTKHWEDPSAANAHVEARVRDAFDPGSEEEDEEGARTDSDKAERERVVEAEWRTKNLVDYGSFNAPDPGRTSRDFAVLKRLFSHLKVDLVELAKLEREAKAHDDLENRVEFERFAFERSFDESHVLRRALKLFEERTGRSAFRVQQEHRLIDDEQIIPTDESADCCWLCGAYLCSVHAGTLCAFNEPTKDPFDPTEPERDGCYDCGSSTCLHDAQQIHDAARDNSVDAVQDALEKALLEEGMPPLDACTTSLLLQRSSSKHPSSSAAKTRRRTRAKKNETNKWHKLELPPNQSDGYSPCACVERCSADCQCVGAKTYCDRWCACPPSCSRRFRGCYDHDCAVSSKCWCLDRSRQCDPQICGCNAATCTNSAIRLGRRKATAVVRSQIPGGGFGAILFEAAEKDEFVDLYAGELHPQGLTDSPTMENKWGHWRATFADASYWFDVDGGDAVDSLLLGNVIRCVNHDRELANVVPRIVNVAGTHQIALYTLRDLEAGDELLLDYGDAYLEPWMETSGGS
ncbi:hypothetical protein JCM9279_000787 [Rhodotorula babjevae]